jgi:NOL1/NOP2/fmu family ribosome biogenesis protein
MANLKILNSKQLKLIKQIVKKQFDCDYAFDYMVMQNPDQKIYLMNKEYKNIDDSKLKINSLGMYFGQVKNGELRLTIEGSQILGQLAKKNVIEINDGLLKLWIRGHDIEVDNPENGFFIVKHKNDYIGSGKLKQGVLLNFISKIRRIYSKD